MDKIIIYQLFLRVFANRNTTNKFYGSLKDNGSGKFSDINTAALKSLKNFGATHIWFTGIIEHATLEEIAGIKGENPQVVKGIAGSPYAIKDYYDVNPYMANDPEQRMKEFEKMVKRTHDEGLKVIIDFVPNHVAREYKSDTRPVEYTDLGEKDDTRQAFSPNNNFYYLPETEFEPPRDHKPPVLFNFGYQEKPAKATGNDVFSPNPSIDDWYETIKLNYGVDYLEGGRTYFDPIPNTWIRMYEILNFWIRKGIDGFRCDMAEMVPVEFWHWVISKIKKEHPDVIFIAEIYNPQRYYDFINYGCFDYLYDKVGLYDAVRRLIEGHGNAMDITDVWQNESGNYSNRMLRFLENHDEQRIASEFFGKNPESGLAGMMLSATLHTGPLMIYGGQELGVKPHIPEGFSGNDGRTTIFDFWGLPEHQGWINDGKYDGGGLDEATIKLRDFYAKINHFVQDNEAVYRGEFHDLQYLNGFWQSENYDERFLYAYLRFTENQKLLFVYNFDLTRDLTFKIRLPHYIFDSNSVNLKFKQVFEGPEEFSIALTEHIEFDLNVQANYFKIFEIL